MAGVDHPAGTSSSADTRPSTGRPRAASVLTGREAVAAVERLLCGDGAVHSASVAEGFALGGRPSATILPGPEDLADVASPAIVAPWVHHTPASRLPRGFSIELAAATVQEAVDHALVARCIATALDRPVSCVLADAAVDAVDRVVLPDRDTIAAVAHDDRHGDAVTGLDDHDSAVAAVEEAFRKVSQWTGRPAAPVTTDGVEDAEHVLVCAGTLRAEAAAIARSMRREGKRCGIVTVHVVQPFPAAALREAVEGVRSLFVVRPADPAARRGGAFLARVRSAFRDREGVQVRIAGPAPQRTEPDRDAGPTVDVRPVGPWAERLLRDAAAAAPDARLRAPSADRPTDVLFVGHPSAIVPGPGDADVRDGGTIVVVAPDGGPEAWWPRWPGSTRRRLAERSITLRWLDLSAVEGLDPADPQAVQVATRDALLAVATGGAVGPAPGRVDREAVRAKASRNGADRQEALNPREVAAPTVEPDAGWVAVTRTFHLTGSGARSIAEPSSAVPLDPVVLGALGGPDAPWRNYPLLVPETPPEGGPLATPLHGLLQDAVEALAEGGQDVSILSNHLPLLTRAAAASLELPGGARTPAALLEAAFVRFRDGFDLSETGAAALVDEIRRLEDRLGERMDAPAEVVGLGPDAALRLYAAAIRAERRPRRAALMSEVTELIERLEEVLRVDDSHAPGSTSPDSLSAALGSAGDALMDPGKLSSHIPERHGSVRISTSRRRRIEHTVGRLRHHLADESRMPDMVVVQPSAMIDADAVARARLVTHPDAALAAIGLFDAAAAEAADLLRAVRVARLEVDGSYEPARHDDALVRFDWQSMTADELRMLPPVVVLETDGRLRGRALGSLSELLRSGRPVHVLATHSTVELHAAPTRDRLARFHPGLGYLAVAHREAFVLQSSLGVPDHLAAGLRRIAHTLRPAVALIAVPEWSASTPPWLQLAAALEGRAAPGFLYDPDAGAHWADRFELDVNPQSDEDWPSHDVVVFDPAGEEACRVETLTFAHAVALDPAYREHFRIVPPEAWTPEQIELSEYLVLPAGVAIRKIPYIRVVSPDGTIARALLTREMAFACLDRLRAWKILQELAGIDNEYARRAAAAARTDAEAEAARERETLEASHSEDLERVRSIAAGEAMDRLVGVLMNLDTAFVPESIPAMPAVPASQPAEVESGAPVEEPEAPAAPELDEDDDGEVGEPYIDTPLCTSCNDCMVINARLFKYDANKQAYIDDPSVGTFDEVVRAAEKCPARCIHPGAPRPDDATASEDLIARAAKYN